MEFNEVDAARRSDSRSDKSIAVAISVKNSTDFCAARWNDSAIVVGWIPKIMITVSIDLYIRHPFYYLPLFNIFSAAESIELHKTTTEVVPSPASTSCAADKSTSYKEHVLVFIMLRIHIPIYHLCCRMKYSHMLENSSTIIGNNNFAVACLNLKKVDVSKSRSGMGYAVGHRTILSMPRGPSDVRIASPTAVQDEGRL